MTVSRWIVLSLTGAVFAYWLMPAVTEPSAPSYGSILGPPPAVPVLTEAPVPSAEPAPRRDRSASPPRPDPGTVSGPFAARPRPPAVMAFGAAAPLAPGQDASSHFWGGVKPDLSD